MIVGVTQVATGVLAFVAPGAFYDLAAGYPPENHHFLRDLGSWNVALGAIALYGARRREWHVALLGFLAVQYILHTISHIVDVSDSDPSWQGPVAVITQGLGAVVLTALFLRERGR
jgi:peptidoglycan/LPS O-acetylase OafA/YrhL